MTKSRSRRIATIIRYTVLTIWAIVAFFPIYWMISTSFKIDTQWFAWPPIYVPDPPTLANYLNVWLGAQETWFVVDRTMTYLAGVVAGQEKADQLGGPIRIAQQTLVVLFPLHSPGQDVRQRTESSGRSEP